MTRSDIHREIERKLHLKASRASKKGVITKQIKKLVELINNVDNLPEVHDTLKRLLRGYQSFLETHDKYHDLIKDDASECKRSYDYFCAVEKDVYDCKRQISDWIKATERPDDIKPSDSVSQISSKLSTKSSVRLRKAEEEATSKALQVQIETLRKQSQLEQRQLDLQRKFEDEQFQLKRDAEELKLKSLLEQSCVRKKVFDDFDEQSLSMKSVSRVLDCQMFLDCQMLLNLSQL